VSSGLSIGIADFETPGTFYVIDLSGAAPTESKFSLPFAGSEAFAAASPASWVAGTQTGVLIDGSRLPGTLRYLDYGFVWSVAGSGSRVVLATASGRVLSFDTVTNTLEQSISLPSAELSLTSDGSVLAAAVNHFNDAVGNDRTISLYAMPQATLMTSFSFTFGENGPVPIDMSIAGSGAALGELQLLPGPQWSAQAVQVPGGGATFVSSPSNTEPGPVRLSPDGTLVAISTPKLTTASNAPTTSIYRGSTQLTTLSGWAVGGSTTTGCS
jgi:hypothetical protein